MTRVWTNKKYKLDRSENFEAFLSAIGLNFFIRKMISALSVTTELVDIGDDEFVIRQQTAFRSIDLKFKPDVEFVDVKPNGTKVLTVMTFEGENVLLQKGLDPPTEIRREFRDGEMVMVSYCVRLSNANLTVKKSFCCICFSYQTLS